MTQVDGKSSLNGKGFKAAIAARPLQTFAQLGGIDQVQLKTDAGMQSDQAAARLASVTTRPAIRTIARANSPPRVYIAGKIHKTDFRHDLVPQLRSWRHEFGPLDCGTFTYVGPFFSSCDHGCRHGPSTHGVTGQGCEEVEATREEVFTRNQAALANADLVFAYIDAPDCHGTLFELGCAEMADTPVFLTFAPGVDLDDFWYPRQCAQRRKGTCIFPRVDLPKTFADVLTRWRRDK